MVPFKRRVRPIQVFSIGSSSLSGSLIQVSNDKRTPKSKLSSIGNTFKDLKKEVVRQCFLFTNHLLITTRSSSGRLHLLKVGFSSNTSAQICWTEQTGWKREREEVQSFSYLPLISPPFAVESPSLLQTNTTLFTLSCCFLIQILTHWLSVLPEERLFHILERKKAYLSLKGEVKTNQ